jgi:hypothetical protein
VVRPGSTRENLSAGLGPTSDSNKARDGSYTRAMPSDDEMREFAEHLGYQMDNAANMDW